MNPNQLNRENLLRKTQYGLQVYAYVLSQFRPAQALRLEGNTCHPVGNPFTGGSQSLVISISDGLAQHTDLQRADFHGDVFDFAQLYFQAESQERLYYLINQSLHLGLKPGEERPVWLEVPDDSWLPRVSYFLPPISNVLPSEELLLQEVHQRITGDNFAEVTRTLRTLKDPKKKSSYKAAHFAYVTFAGRFARRQDSALLQSSLLMAFDFDHLKDLPRVKEQLLNLRFFDTELLFTSPSGDGLKWIIRFDRNDISYEDYFLSVAHYLYHTLKIRVDKSGKDLSRACFLPHDPEAYLNPRHGGFSYEL